MKNILYVGPYKENNGYGRSSRRIIDSFINDSNINLSIRPVYFTSKIYNNLNPIYTDFENNRQNHYDCIIQHGYPEMFHYDGRFGKNIGITQIETRKLTHSKYIDNINLLDKIVVGSLFSAESLLESGIRIETKIVPEPYDLISFNQETAEFFENKTPDSFIFYTIGQYTDKKNIKGIILAFLLEFNTEDNVELFIKTDSYHISSTTLEELISADIEEIKNIIRRNPSNCPKVSVLAGFLEDKDMIRLHKSCDCYVDAARADGNGCCAIEALLCDNQIISTSGIASSNFIGDDGFIVDSTDSNVFSTDIHSDHSFTIHELWYEPNIDSLRQKMREAYNNRSTTHNDKELFNNIATSQEIYE
jgi:hypothetical protein